MSTRSESRDETTSRTSEETIETVVSRLEDWYHVPVLVATMVAMLWIRLQSYDAFTRDGEIYLSGNDGWYHLREVQYTVQNWPSTMPFDPWTYFPFGTSTGQFGTLYDQLIATGVLLVGLGSPTQEQIMQAMLVATPVFGALTVIPVYLIGKRLGGRVAGLFGAVLLALLPGSFLQRTLVASADHNGAEPFFQAFAVVGLLAAFVVAEREKPVWELVVDRDFAALRTPAIWSAVGGFGVAMYLWMWPPGVLLVGLAGLFFTLKFATDVYHGSSPEPVAFAGAVSMTVTGLLLFVPIQSFGFSPTRFSLLQPLLAFGVAAGCVFLAWLAREWESRDLDSSLYPVAVFGLLLVGVGLLSVVLPSVYKLIVNNLVRTVGFSTGAQTRTIVEASPFLSDINLQRYNGSAQAALIANYGLTFFTAAGAVIWLLAKPLVKGGETRKVGYVIGSLLLVAAMFFFQNTFQSVGSAVGLNSQLLGLGVVTALIVGAALLTEYRTEHLFVVVWAAFITSAAFTQIRFNYYLAVVVVVLNAYLLGELITILGVAPGAWISEVTKKSPVEAVQSVPWYKVMTVVAVVTVITVPVLIQPMTVGASPQGGGGVQTATAWEIGNNTAPQDITQWDDSLQWMNENTPEEGEFGGADNRMEYYGTYQEGDGDFAYPEGSYGVQSWWDYGHWITVRGERIPNANPFQQGATSAANFMLAPDERQAQQVLARQSTEGNQTRYVMIDWQMATTGNKFDAMTVFYDEQNTTAREFYQPVYVIGSSGGQQRVTGTYDLHNQRYYDSMVTRLYQFHGSAIDPQPLVIDYELRETSTGQQVPVVISGSNETGLRTFDSMEAARQYVEEDGTARVGGLGQYPGERVPALEHYRLVHTSENSAYNTAEYTRGLISTSRATGVSPTLLNQNQPAWVKTFERVPGATVEGSGAPANTTVTARVQMENPAANSTFTYSQQARTNEDGEFTMTVPYSTTGYDEYGPENGYTDVNVRATGSYNVSTGLTQNESGAVVQYGAQFDVSEGQVNGAEDGPVTVELDSATLRPAPSDGSSGTETGSENGTNSTALTTPDSLSLADDAAVSAGDSTTDTTFDLGGSPGAVGSAETYAVEA
ncbi:oligosaccharyl transferase, archaeosortase A system-associated [Salinirubrum litoreum]|uniref:dolichyl-phosphooligosaccharide-protein glycotransferase n=1 Tax=Salinirubrum litoreum TaxID=1126234 RepID=A0ABD5R6E7_9EURY|nr:oligosaccharyl transferase, archaeosortase A system-associated [Salinirubrum litoreum]